MFRSVLFLGKKGLDDGRKNLYESMFGCDAAVVTILAICPTRWCVRTIAIKPVCSAYRQITETLEQLKDDQSVRGETRAKIGGLYKKALKAKTYFGLLCCAALYEPCESAARGLPLTNASALGAIECPELLRKRVEALRDDAVVENMMHMVATAGLKISAASSERTVSTLRRLKTCLRTTMTQK